MYTLALLCTVMASGQNPVMAAHFVSQGPPGQSISMEAGDAEDRINKLFEKYATDSEPYGGPNLFYDWHKLRQIRTHVVRNAPDWLTALRQMLIGTPLDFSIECGLFCTVYLHKIPEPTEVTVAVVRHTHPPIPPPKRLPATQSSEKDCVCVEPLSTILIAGHVPEWQRFCRVGNGSMRWAPSCERSGQHLHGGQ